VEGSAGVSALVPPRSAPGQAGACRIRVCVRAVTGRGARKPRESRIKARRLFLTEPAPAPRVIRPSGLVRVQAPRRRKLQRRTCTSCKLERIRSAYMIGVKTIISGAHARPPAAAPAPLARGRSVRSRAHRSRAVLERVIYRKATETRTDSLAPAVSSRAAEC